jgi:ribonuclease VapC
MFVEASALVAILTFEDEQLLFLQKIENEPYLATSALTVFEATMAVARKKLCGIDVAQKAVSDFLREIQADVLVINHITAKLALDAFATFGKGRHRAGLNMGDCFSYACAKQHGLSLLFKGDDFNHTDVRIA